MDQEPADGSHPRPGGVSRRQALNACDACRRRKTKCDEQRPACSRCQRLGLDCAYVDNVAYKKGLSVVELSGTLQRMDDRLELLTKLVQSQQVNSTSSTRQDGASRSSMEIEHDSRHIPQLSGQMEASLVSSPQFLDTGRVRDELSLTQKHCVAPQHLLKWPCSPYSITESELQYPLLLETTRPRLLRHTEAPLGLAYSHVQDNWVARLSMSQINLLTRSYFAHYHPRSLILDETHFYSSHLAQAIRTDFGDSVDTCIVLVVCALGSIAAYYDGHTEWTEAEDLDIGFGFFNLARDKFTYLEKADWPSVQCLLLMGMFYSAKLRIHEAWRATYHACGTILILAPLQNTLNAEQCQLFWIAYLQESQVLAEFDLPSSGLGKLANSIPLPVVPSTTTDPALAQYQLFFLALIAIRKLLNRILLYVYSQDQPEDAISVRSPTVESPAVFLSTPRSMISELDRQLEEWRECLPSGLRFATYTTMRDHPLPDPEKSPSMMERLQGNLMARYFTAKSIIYRPFIYRALHPPYCMQLTEEDRAGACTAVGAAFMHLAYSGLLNEPLTLLFHPMNSWRSFFALAIQVSLITRVREAAFALPENWGLVEEARQRIAAIGARMSPTIARDNEILESLNGSQHTD